MLFRSNDTATTEIYTTHNTLSLHDALPISTWSPGRPSGSWLSPAPVPRRSTGLSPTAWRRRPGYDSSWRSFTARSPRARSSTATTSAPCTSPPTPSSISGRSMWRSTYTSCATEYGDVRVLHVPTTYQFADIFTKGLPSSTFSEFRSSLNVAGG